ncbi:MAG TPA: hypothetical protein PL105_06880 [Caldilineaceae bacterium]|nr:hypothetical protein [Caldilineaceae bacterium]
MADILWMGLGVALGVLLSEWATLVDVSRETVAEEMPESRWPGVLVVDGEPTVRFMICPPESWPCHLQN